MLKDDCRRRLRAWAEIDLDALRANVQALRDYFGPPTRLLAVVKADAYGHGLVPVARAALEAGADWLGVATTAEGVALRDAGLTAPILMLCIPFPAEAETILAHRLTPILGDLALLNALSEAKRAKPSDLAPEVHLEIDTGMGRSGAAPETAVTLWRAATDAGLRVTGLCTHFADADGASERLTRHQIALFQQTRAALEEAGARFDLLHLANSASVLRFPAAGSLLARPGLLLYGILPPIPDRDTATANRPSLQPVLTLKARVASVRELPAGHPISYGATHRLTRPSLVATVLIGYGDGYPRRLSNCGHMLIKGHPAPILGRVCMDQTVVDVTDIPGVVPGEEAVCIGAQGAERITVEEIAARIGATEHEITTGLSSRIPRLTLPLSVR